MGSESRFSPSPPAFDAPLGGSRRNIAIPFVAEKLELCGYPTVKKFRRYLYLFDRMYERDGHTDRHTHRHRMTAKAALNVASRGKKMTKILGRGQHLGAPP